MQVYFTLLRKQNSNIMKKEKMTINKINHNKITQKSVNLCQKYRNSEQASYQT